MKDQSFVMGGDIAVNVLKWRLLRRDVLPRGIHNFHSYVLPDFCRNRAVCEVVIYTGDGIFGKIRVLKKKGIESCAELCVSGVRFNETKCVFSLLLHRFEIRIGIVHIQDIQNMHVQVIEHSGERGRAPKDVGVRVNGFERSEFHEGAVT